MGRGQAVAQGVQASREIAGSITDRAIGNFSFT